jgi:hypothetical protein
LILYVLLYWRRSLRGTLLLLGTLAYFLYIYGGYALGAVTYNRLFLIYAALLSLSFYGVVLAFRTAEQQLRNFHHFSQLPRRAPALFLFGSGLFPSFA